MAKQKRRDQFIERTRFPKKAAGAKKKKGMPSNKTSSRVRAFVTRARGLGFPFKVLLLVTVPYLFILTF